MLRSSAKENGDSKVKAVNPRQIKPVEIKGMQQVKKLEMQIFSHQVKQVMDSGCSELVGVKEESLDPLVALNVKLGQLSKNQIT